MMTKLQSPCYVNIAALACKIIDTKEFPVNLKETLHLFGNSTFEPSYYGTAGQTLTPQLTVYQYAETCISHDTWTMNVRNVFKQYFNMLWQQIW